MRSKGSSFPSGFRPVDQGRTRDLHRFERSLSCRSLGSSHGVAPRERLFVIDVAFASFSPTKIKCQYVKNVPICYTSHLSCLSKSIHDPPQPLHAQSTTALSASGGFMRLGRICPTYAPRLASGFLNPAVGRKTTFQGLLNPYLLAGASD